jgi:hypothetical protein
MIADPNGGAITFVQGAGKVNLSFSGVGFDAENPFRGFRSRSKISLGGLCFGTL